MYVGLCKWVRKKQRQKQLEVVVVAKAIDYM